MPGGDGGRHLACGLGVSFAGCAAKQGLGRIVENEAPNPGPREGGRATRGVRERWRDGVRSTSRDASPSSAGTRTGGSFGIRHSGMRERVGGPEAANVVAGRVH